MRLLQRYILFELLRVFAFVLSVVTVLLVFVGVFREVSESGLGPVQVLQILPFVVPSLMPFTIPATLLLTVCVVYGRMAGDQEITAAKAAGVNVLSLLWPAFLLGAVLSVGSLVLADQVIPWAVGNIQRTVTLAMEDIFLDVLRKNYQVTDQDRGYSITVMGVEGKTLILPTFQYSPPGHGAITMQAQEAHLEFDLDRQQVILHLKRGHIDVPGQRRVWFVKEDRPFPLPLDIDDPKPRHQSIREIRTSAVKLRHDLKTNRERRDLEIAMALAIGNYQRFLTQEFVGHDLAPAFFAKELIKLQTEVHSRFALATSCLFFAMLGAPFAILQARRQFLTSFFLCFVPILLVYYPIVLLTLNLSKNGMADPAWAMWIGNVLLVAASAVVLRRVLKH